LCVREGFEDTGGDIEGRRAATNDGKLQWSHNEGLHDGQRSEERVINQFSFFSLLGGLSSECEPDFILQER
jgi:hypothetical protein